MSQLTEAKARIALALKKGSTELDLSGLEINVLPEKFVEIAPLLTVLFLSKNKFQAVPREIGLCSNLQRLDLSENEIRTGYGLASPRKLTHLSLEKNKFSDFPTEVLELPQLRQLFAGGNDFARLPGGIRLLKNLETLDLSQCRIETLPTEIAEMPNLKDLILDGNPLRTPPIEIAAQGVGAIRAYFDDLTRDQKQVESKNWLLAVAIENYPPEFGYSARPGCVKEAAELVEVLKEKYDYRAVTTLWDAQATRAAFFSALEDLVKNTGLTDSVIVYFNGWTGDGRPESDLRSYDNAYIQLPEVLAQFSAMRARHVLLIVDNHLQSRQFGTTRGVGVDREVLASRWALYRLGADWEDRFTPAFTQYLESYSLDIPFHVNTFMPPDKKRGRYSVLTIPFAGDEGGSFLFKKNNELDMAEEDWQQIQYELDDWREIQTRRYEQEHGSGDDDRDTFNWADNEHAIYAYEMYLNDFPQGKYAEEARKRVKALEVLIEDEKIWKEALSINTILAYEDFLNNTKSGAYSQDASRRISDLQLLEQENQTLADIQNDPTQQNIQSYLTTFPNGQHRSRVEKILADLEITDEKLWQEAGQKNTIEAYQAYQQQTKTGKYTSLATSRIAELESTQGRLVNEAKLIFVGNGRAGKTSISKVLRGLPFDPKEKSTHGIYIEKWNVKAADGQELTINIWDFGGQEIYHNTHSFFLTKRALYLFVWSAASQKDALEHPEHDDRERNFPYEYWLDTVRVRSQGSPVLMLQNRFDREQPAPLDQTRFAAPYHVQGFQDIDIQYCTPAEIESLREKLVEQYRSAAGLKEYIPFRLPNEWLAVRLELEKRRDTDKFISKDEYLKICLEKGTTGAESLGTYLHDIGSILFFPEGKNAAHTDLNDIVILDPIWVTDIIYRILNQQVKDSGGRFRRSDLKAEWAEKVPAEFAPGFRFSHVKEVEIFLQLMQKFEVCFELPGEPGEFVAPQFLSPQKPDLQWDSTRCRRFGYRYEFLPRQVIARAIARLGASAKAGDWWRDGILVSRKNTQAKIETDGDKLLWVEILGENPDSMQDWLDDHFAVLNEKLPAVPVVFCPACDQPTLLRDEILTRQKKGKSDITCPVCKADPLISKILQTGKNDMVPKIFISYAHADTTLKDEFMKRMSMITKYLKKATAWTDAEIAPGADWKQEILSRLGDADLVVCLLSPDFMDSDFIIEDEVQTAFNLEKRLVPVYIRRLPLLSETPLAQKQGTPKDDNGRWKPVNSWDDKDEAWARVVEDIKRAIDAL